MGGTSVSKKSGDVASSKELAKSFRGLLIDDPRKHRAVLLLTMEGLLGGMIDVARANAMANLSSEVHKSLKQEWDMKTYAAGVSIGPGGCLRLVDRAGVEDVEDAGDEAG
jgi:hypothetical protein